MGNNTKTGAELMQEVLDALQISVVELARTIGVSRSAIAKYSYKPGYKFTSNIAIKISQAFPEINLKYLLEGEGELILKPEKQAGQENVLGNPFDFNLALMTKIMDLNQKQDQILQNQQEIFKLLNQLLKSEK